MPRIDRRASARALPSSSSCAECLETRRLLSAALLKDINAHSFGSSSGYFTPFHGFTYFSGGGQWGTELYRSAGPGQPAELVRDIVPGPAPSYPAELTVVGDTLFFRANAGASGEELWKSDGTAAGTVLVKDLWPGTQSSIPRNLTALNDTLLFTDQTGIFWMSNGAEAGTVRLADTLDPALRPMFGAMASAILVTSGAAYFQTTNDVTGGPGTLWRTDGTPAGTSATVGDLGTIYSLTRLDDSRFVIITGDPRGDGTGADMQLWVSDGTPAGTQRVRTFAPFDGRDTAFVRPVNVDGTILFRRQGQTHRPRRRQRL